MEQKLPPFFKTPEEVNMSIEKTQISKDSFVILAASAPKEIPSWFSPIIEPYDTWKYKHPQSGECDQVRHRWYREEEQKEKILQWPKAYAEEVLKRL